jgi:hypothetical protein
MAYSEREWKTYRENFMPSERVNTKIWGIVAKASPEQRKSIDTYVATFPADVYQALNESLAVRGLRLGIGSKREHGEMSERRAQSDEGTGMDIMSDLRVGTRSGPVGE